VADQPLIKYQLKLQKDPDELKKFKAGGETARASMRAHDVPEGVHEALLGGHEEKIVHALNREMLEGAAPPANFGGDGTWNMTHFRAPQPNGGA